MTLEFHWIKSPQVVGGTVAGVIGVEDLKELLLGYLNAVGTEEQIHLVVNNNMRRLPGGLIEFRDTVYPLLQHPNLGWTVIYGLENHFVKALIETLLMVQHRSFYFAATRAEAVAFLQSTDSSLPELEGVE